MRVCLATIKFNSGDSTCLRCRRHRHHCRTQLESSWALYKESAVLQNKYVQQSTHLVTWRFSIKNRAHTPSYTNPIFSLARVLATIERRKWIGLCRHFLFYVLLYFGLCLDIWHKPIHIFLSSNAFFHCSSVCVQSTTQVSPSMRGVTLSLLRRE